MVVIFLFLMVKGTTLWPALGLGRDLRWPARPNAGALASILSHTTALFEPRDLTCSVVATSDVDPPGLHQGGRKGREENVKKNGERERAERAMLWAS